MSGRGDPRFHALLEQIGELHDRKQEDYGKDSDPFANVRASQDFGIPPWVGALVRLNDKVHRLKQFAQRGALANESAEDSMMDIAVYALIALVLYREEAEAPAEPTLENRDPLTPHWHDKSVAAFSTGLTYEGHRDAHWKRHQEPEGNSMLTVGNEDHDENAVWGSWRPAEDTQYTEIPT